VPGINFQELSSQEYMQVSKGILQSSYLRNVMHISIIMHADDAPSTVGLGYVTTTSYNKMLVSVAFIHTAMSSKKKKVIKTYIGIVLTYVTYIRIVHWSVMC